ATQVGAGQGRAEIPRRRGTQGDRQGAGLLRARGLSAFPANGMTAGGRSLRWRTERVRVGDLDLRIGRRGSGPPLLLLTGIGANIEMWQPFGRLLRGREVIALDAP